MLNLFPLDTYNQELINNVHPQTWKNPKPQPKYNLVVIGAGTAGLITAIATASLGGKVALIEKHLMGGDCLNVGCVPSKALISAAKVAYELQHASEFGFENHSISEESFGKVMERVRKVRAEISKNDSAKRYTDLGVDVFIGEGKFSGKNTIQVGNDQLHFSKAVIATGARAGVPPIPGIHSIDFLTNETIFNLTERPKHLIVIGGGPIGCELAQAFRRLGTKVSLIQDLTFLPTEDPEAAAILENVFKREGIDVYVNAKITQVEPVGQDEKQITVESNGKTVVLKGSHVLVSAGRTPNVENIGLELVGVEYDKRFGVKVDDNLRTTNKNIFAAGDCCMRWKFTHAADQAAQIVVQNALFKGNKKLSALTMPWCTYTQPEIAHVGWYERDAKENQVPVDFFKFDMSENDRAIAEGKTDGFVKVMVKKGTDQILGATIVASNAGDMISEISTAMAAKMGLGALSKVIHPYPTQAEAIKRVAGLYNKTRLTPFVAKLFKKWLNFQL